MKRVLIVAVAVLLTPCIILGQSKQSVEDRIISLERQLGATFEKADAATFERLVAKDAVVVTARGRTIDRARWLAGLRESAGTSDDHKVIVRGDTAIATHRSTVKGQDYRTTHVWQRTEGQWRLVSAQNTAIAEGSAPSEPAGLTAGCEEASFNPEVHQFYGNSAGVLAKLENRDLALPNRRMYVLLIETSDGAELALFERSSTSPGMVAVAHWRGTSAASLREELTKTILENRGIACIGAQSKAIVTAALRPEDLGRIPAPVSAQAAFGHFIKRYGPTYLRASIFLLC